MVQTCGLGIPSVSFLQSKVQLTFIKREIFPSVSFVHYLRHASFHVPCLFMFKSIISFQVSFL